MQRTFQHCIATKWLEIDQDNLRIKFLALHVDFSSPSLDLLGLRRPAQVGVEYSYPPFKKWLFYRYLARVAWKRLQTDGQIHATYCNNNKLFIVVNIDDLELLK